MKRNLEISNNVLALAGQIKDNMKVTEDGLIEAGDVPTPPVDSEKVRYAAMARMLQLREITGLFTSHHIGFAPEFIENIRQEVARYLRGTYVLRHKGSAKRRHKLRTDGAYIKIAPMTDEAQKNLDAAYDAVLKKKGLLRRAVFGDLHIGSEEDEIRFPTVVVTPSTTRDQIMGGHVTQVPVNRG